MAELLLRERVLAWCLDEAERRDGQLDAILARQLDLTPDWAAIRADIQRRIAEKF